MARAPRARQHKRWAKVVLAPLTAVALVLFALPAGASEDQGSADGRETPTADLWTPVAESLSAQRGREPDIRPDAFRAFVLDRDGMAAALAEAPAEVARTTAAGLEIAVPAPDGGFERFAVQEAPIMEPGLAAEHPDITTYSGRGIDDPAATIRADLTPLGFHASVRSPQGAWYVDPAFKDGSSRYVVYFGRDLTDNPHGTFVEHEDEGIAGVEKQLGGLADDIDRAEAQADATTRLRTYRLALLSDPTYADYFGAENVTAAKVTLMNRVNQIYEDESAIRLLLVENNDAVNLDTDAAMTGAGGPCGDAPCYTPAQASGCSGQTLNRTRVVIGQIIGASNYDIGHIIFGLSGGGIAGLRVVGGDGKARGCTGLPHPVGDYFAVDYVAHEMGHQFGANHTFNGNQGACSGRNRNGATSVEPGSGSSIMAYAGICARDDLQPHTDPYWSQRSYEEIAAYTTDELPAIDEVQTVSLRGFDRDADSFTLTFDRFQSPRIVRGVNYTRDGIEEAIEAIRDWPDGATVDVRPWGGGGGSLDDAGFQVTFGGTLADTDVATLELDGRGVSGFGGETATGGPIDNQGWDVTDTGNHAPEVEPVGSTTIPYRTPFALTGDATDADGDTVTYLWEQNDRGLRSVSLLDPVKTTGPLFRVFGTALDQEIYDPREYDSPGTNSVSTDPTRVFPDMAQIVAGNTNAKTGDCPGTPPPPPATVPPATVDCYSEFLPTSAYAGDMSFRLTVRDGNPGAGGVSSRDGTVSLAPGTGPFLVTSQAVETTYPGASTQTVTWDVAGTDVPPIDTSAVRISLSTDGGFTYPHELEARTPNDGSAEVTLPNLSTDTARIKVEAVDNIYFAINDADITIEPAPEVSHDADGGSVSVQYSDAITPVTVSASDEDTAGAVLSAEASGLPAGLSLTAGSVSEDAQRPGTRSWTVEGTTTASPGSYPVTVTVSDDTGGVGSTSFTIEVEPEDAAASYVGDTLSAGTVQLRAVVHDSSVVEGSGDSSAGDIRNATVSFVDGSSTLCGPVPVQLTGSSETTGTASCEADLPSGDNSVAVVVGGSYVAPPAAATVSVSEPGRSFVTGGGALALDAAAGSYAVTPGSSTSVQLNARHRRGVVGKVELEFVSEGDVYRLETTSLESFGVAGAAAEIRGTARIVATDTGDIVVTDATVHAALVDNGAPGRHDTLAVTVWGSDGTLLLSTDWTGDRTAPHNLSGGNLTVHR